MSGNGGIAAAQMAFCVLTPQGLWIHFDGLVSYALIRTWLELPDSSTACFVER